jgi:hypothetical protein
MRKEEREGRGERENEGWGGGREGREGRSEINRRE